MAALAEIENDVEGVEKETELLRLEKLSPVYLKRKAAIAGIPGFWKVVLSQHSDFANYVRAADLKYIDCIFDIEVQWHCVRDKEADNRDFTAVSYTHLDVYKRQVVVLSFTSAGLMPS